MESQIQEVKSKIDIVQLISGYISLKKAGRNYKGLCPFHSEKTPSFMVSSERQIFKCFGCNEGGDVLAFYQKIEGLEFSEAFKALALRAGIQIRESKTSQSTSQKEIFADINSVAAEFFHYLLTQHRSGKRALDYLKSRGLVERTIQDWQLGFAPDSWDFTYKYLLKKNKDPKDIMAAGLALPSRRQGAYDRFRKRIMFPIRNVSGTIVGFSGRIFGDPLASAEPKYLNSPDNLLFNKSNNLFGLDKAKTEVKRLNQAVLVEGNLDVILSHQIGVTNVICPLGTALTEKQIDLIKRFTDQLSIAFDQDKSGLQAALRAVDLVEKANLNLRLVEISAKDPDELIRKNPTDWKEALKKATPIYDFLLSSSSKRYPTNDPNSIKKISQEVLPYLAKIDNELTRSHYERLLASKLGVSEDSVKIELNKLNQPKPLPGQEETEKKPVTERLRLETYLLELILQSGLLPKSFSAKNLENNNFRSLLELAEKQATNQRFQIEAINPPEELKDLFDKLTLADLSEKILKDQDKTLKEIETCTLRIKELNLRTELKKTSLAIKQAEIAQDEGQIKINTKKFQEFSDQLANLEKQKELI